MAITLNSNFGGEVYEDFLSRATLGAETINGGYAAVHTQIMDKKSLPRIEMANIIQDHAETPASAGTINVDERVLEPVPFLAFQTFNPRKFESFWEFANPTTGDLTMRELPLAAQVAFLQEIARLTAEFMETGFWQATTATGAAVLQDKWDGIYTRAAADGSVNSVGTPVALTAANILDEIARTKAALIAQGTRGRAVWSNVETCKIFVSHRDADFMRDAVEDMSINKGPTVMQNYDLTFQGREVVPLTGIPDGKIIITSASSNPLTSNIHLGIDWQYNTAEPVIQIGKYRPESELYFFKLLMQADTNYTWSEELALYDGS